MQPDCLKGRVVCGTVYGDMRLKDLLGSIVREGYRIPGPGFLSSAAWPLLPKKHYNGLINQSNFSPLDVSEEKSIFTNKLYISDVYHIFLNRRDVKAYENQYFVYSLVWYRYVNFQSLAHGLNVYVCLCTRTILLNRYSTYISSDSQLRLKLDLSCKPTESRIT